MKILIENENEKIINEVEKLGLKQVKHISNSEILCLLLIANKLKLANEINYLNNLMSQIDIERS